MVRRIKSLDIIRTKNSDKPKKSYLKDRNGPDKERLERRDLIREKLFADDPFADDDDMPLPPPPPMKSQTASPYMLQRRKTITKPKESRKSRSLSPKRDKKGVRKRNKKKKDDAQEEETGEEALKDSPKRGDISPKRGRITRKFSFGSKKDKIEAQRKLQQIQQNVQNAQFQVGQPSFSLDDGRDSKEEQKAEQDAMYRRAARLLMQRRVERSQTDGQDLENLQTSLLEAKKEELQKQKRPPVHHDDSDSEYGSDVEGAGFNIFVGPGLIQRGLQALEQMYDDNYAAKGKRKSQAGDDV